MSAPAHAQLTCESNVLATADHTVNSATKENFNLIQDATDSNNPASDNNAAQDADGDRHGGNTADDEATPDVDEDAQKSKKKKKRKSKKKKRKPVTGFEEFFADAPLTPAEALYEQEELYSSNRLFIDRIEECIQRYRARRKMDSEQTFMFNKYMFLGGVDSEQRQFTGIAQDIEALVDMEGVKDAQRAAMARDFIGNGGTQFYQPGSKDWVVDFEAIVKGFLSRTITDLYLYDDVAIAKATTLVKNFLNYVLTHDVCPEYKDNIIAARHICDIAPSELHATHLLSKRLPGPFHRAAAELLLGKNKGDDSSDTDVADGGASGRRLKQMALLKSALSTTPDHGHLVSLAIAACGDEKRVQVSEEKEQTYIIISIQRAARVDRENFARQMHDSLTAITPFEDHGVSTERDTTITTNDDGDHDSEIRDVHDDDEDEEAEEEKEEGGASKDPVHRAGPLGILTLRPAIIDSGYDNVPRSRTTGKILAASFEKNRDGYAGNDIRIPLEDNLLSLCEVGMKLQLVTHELQLQLVGEVSCPYYPAASPSVPDPVQATSDVQAGKLRVITACTDVRVSFDTFLPQMLMAHWREPVANTRPPPSVRDPEADVVEGSGSDNGYGGDEDIGGAEK